MFFPKFAKTKVTSTVSKTRERGVKATFGQCPKGSSFFFRITSLTPYTANTFNLFCHLANTCSTRPIWHVPRPIGGIMDWATTTSTTTTPQHTHPHSTTQGEGGIAGASRKSLIANQLNTAQPLSIEVFCLNK